MHIPLVSFFLVLGLAAAAFQQPPSIRAGGPNKKDAPGTHGRVHPWVGAHDTPPFAVAEFYFQVFPGYIEGGLWYWLEFNISSAPNAPSTYCYDWAPTTTLTTLDSAIASASCSDTSHVGGTFTWSFTPFPDNATAVNSTLWGAWAFSAAYRNEETAVVGPGVHTVLRSDFGLAETEGVEVLYYSGSGDFSLNVSAAAQERRGRRMYEEGRMQRLW